MSPIESYQKLKRIKELADHRATGTPRELSARLEISERTLYRMINYLKEYGLPISYSRPHRSYVLEEDPQW